MYKICFIKFSNSLFISEHKGHRGVHLDFHKLILFYRVLSELSDIFNSLKKFKVIFEMYAIKVSNLNRFLMEGVNQKHKKKDYLIKNLSPP